MKLKLNLSFGFGIVFAALLAGLNPVSAQCSRVIQNGTVSNNAAVVWVAPCVLGQAGPSSGSGGIGALPMITDLGVQGSLGILDSTITGPYHQGLFDWSQTTAGEFDLNLSSFGGAALPSMAVILNGIKYPFPGAGNGNVIAPTSPFPTAGDVPEWNGGTNLIDSGIPIASILSSPTVASIVALKAYSVSGLSAGFILNVSSYRSVGDMPADAYQLALSSCSLNAGIGDGFSQIPSNTANHCWNILPRSTFDIRQAGVTTGGADSLGTNAAQFQAAVNYIESFGGTLTLGGQTIGYTGPININSFMTLIGPGTLESLGATGFSAGGTQTETRTYWLNSGSVTVSGAVSALNAQWSGALPIGMININSGAGGTTLDNFSMNCNLQSNCSNIIENSNSNTLQNLSLSEFRLFGIAGFQSMAGISNIQIFEDSSPANWTGTGIGCLYNGVTDDSIVGPQVVIHAAGMGVVAGCGDFKFFGNHIFPAPVGPSNWNAMVLNLNNSTAAINNNTFDNSRVVWQRPGGASHIGQLQMKGNVWEFGSGGTVDANLVLQCLGSVCGDTINTASNITLSGAIPDNANGTILAAYAPVALEDQNGNLNADSWTVYTQQLWGSVMNACTYSCTNIPQSNVIPQGTQFTFTANVTSSSFQLTSASILPIQGTSLTVSGCGASVVGGQITDISYSQNRIWYAGATTGTGTNCTISVGSLSLTGTIGTNNNIISNINLSDFDLYESITDSGSCIPANSWVSGYNEHTGVVLFSNDGGSAPATCSSTNDTITITPYHYYVAPSDASALILANTANNTTLFLRDDIPRGWFTSISPRNGAASVVLNPLGSASINGGTTNVTLIDNNFAIDQLNAASQMPTRYSIPNGTIAVALGPSSLTGFGSGALFSPLAPASTLAFGVNVGTTAGSAGTIHFTQAAPNGWSCSGSNTTTPANNLTETAFSAQTAQISNYNAGTLTNFVNNAVLLLSCAPF